MQRKDKRGKDQLREISIVQDIKMHAEGSA